MLVGYARVSTQAQEMALQLDALKQVGCEKIFEEKPLVPSATGPHWPRRSPTCVPAIR